MKTIALIPARYHATRFPAKLMQELHGKTIIRRTYEAVVETKLFDEVIVVCDHELIQNEIESCGGTIFFSTQLHESGSDRIAEAAKQMNADIIVNIQGDEPFIDKQSLASVLALFQNTDVKIASLMLPITDSTKLEDPNCVKVVVDNFGKALYFSRATIPYVRDVNEACTHFQHIGVYAYRKEALLHFTSLAPSKLEKIEKLENLRLLENGIPIHLAIVDHVGISIDTEADFKKASAYLDEQKNK